MAYDRYNDHEQYLLDKIIDLEDRIMEITNQLDYINSMIDNKDNINDIDIKILEQYIRERKMRKINEK